MYPYRSDGYGYGSAASSRSYQQQAPRAASSIASQSLDDDLPMYVLREDTLQSRYAVPSDRLQAQYYAGSGAGHYDESTLRAASQRYYDEGSKRLRTTYPETYQDPRSARYQAHAAPTGGYPQRPGEQKCSFYMRTGKCSYGSDCKFDHPAWVPPEGIPGWKEEEGEFPQRPGQPHCAYFLKNGTCKFGSTCKFDHPGAKPFAGRSVAAAPVERLGLRSDVFGTTAPMNSKGLPLRPSEPLCQFFRKTGDCKYGVLCKFDHPEPGSSKRKRASDDDLQDVPLYAVLPGSSYAGNAAPPARAVALPQRPGQPECAYYIRTGTCQYGATCKYNHPLPLSKRTEQTKAKPAKASPPAAGLTPAGLPRRPGATLCAYYMKTGLCKYAPDCKFDHPPPGEAAKMAYRAAAAEKAAPPAAGSAGGVPSKDQKVEEQSAAQTVENVAVGNTDGQGEAVRIEEKAPEEAEKEGLAEQEGGGFEGEAWSPEAGVETEAEEGADVVGGEHVSEGAVEGNAGAEQEAGAAEGETPAEAAEQGPVETAPTEAAEQGPVETALTEDAEKEAVLPSQAEVEQAIENEAMQADEAEVAQAAVPAEGPGTVEQEEQAGGENDGDELDFVDAEGLENEDAEGYEGGLEHESMLEGGVDLNAEPTDEVE
ncbi:hypothetical protein KFL_002260130 [Klebsormidium nitens]|uniref:C3H1-type domain-containing protein n=1 Tax=Klebsormidium nitens TaxID=105231 RepID=A0A1Y1I982_KLENI|nr:hypothetical protein KFL_002260130 [Klebsormidium nitens]|eukprot:GAQ85257.1 hypothetical protein KFL_002260130 [Klebsormidium nitens]